MSDVAVNLGRQLGLRSSGRININWYEPRLDLFLNQPFGEFGLHLKSRKIDFIIAAKRQVGVRTGELQSSIMTLKHEKTPYGQLIRVGSRLKYAYYHHEGTAPHIIRGRRVNATRRRVLRFVRGGTVVFRHSVAHPGTRPNRFLSDNLPIFVV